MSSQIPPDPITNTFNPGAWDLPELPPAQQAVLDTKYVKFPTAQNAPITFPNTITTNGVTTPSVTSTGALDIALPAASVLNVGVIAARSVVHHYSDGDNPTGAVHLNNGTTNNSRTRIHDGTGVNATGIVDIMSSALNSGTINIGAAATTTNILGTLKSNTLDATANNSAQTIGSNLTTGSIALGDALTSGNITMGASQVEGGISIGLSATRTGDINIGNNMMGGIIKIGSFLGVGSTASVQLGTSGKGTNYLRGAILNINDSTGDTNVGTGALGATNYVSIASSGSNNAASYMNLGSDTLGTTYFRSRTIDINGNGAGNTSIGSTTGSGTFTLYQPITVGYLPSAILTNTQIGYNASVTITAIAMTNNTDATTTNQAFGAGVWLINAQFQLGSGTWTGMASCDFRIKKDGSDIMRTRRGGTTIDPTVDNIVDAFSAVFSGPCNITLVANLNATGFTTASFFPDYNYVRIA